MRCRCRGRDQGAQRRLLDVLRAELRRRFPLARARAKDAYEHWMAAQAEFNRFDVLASEVQRAVNNHTASQADLLIRPGYS